MNIEKTPSRDANLGKILKVLFEKKGKKLNEYVGRSDYFYPVTVQSQDEIIGTIRNVKVELCLKHSVKGSLLD